MRTHRVTLSALCLLAWMGSEARAGLITRLAFDGDLLDPISGNDGTWVSTAAVPTPLTFVEGHDGNPAGAVSFDGTSYVRLAYTSGLPLIQHPDITIAMWVKGNVQQDRRVFSEGSSTSNTPLYNVGTDTSNVNPVVDLFIRDSGNVTRLNHFRSGAAFNGQWHHVAVTDRNGIVRVYVDGVLVGSTSYVRASWVVDRTVIGAILRAVAGSYFTGAIDDVRLYNHALSLGEILDLVPVPAGCISSFSMDGSLIDSVSGNDGTYNGGAETYVDGFDGTPGGAISFDGASYVRLSQTFGLPLRNNTALSIAMWVKGPDQADRRVFSESNTMGNNTPLYNLGSHNPIGTGAASIFIRQDAGGTQVDHYAGKRPAFDDTWHHVAMVDDNGKLTLYVDGTQEGTAPTYVRGALTTDVTTLGGILRATTAALFTGAIDEVKLYTRAIPAEEVRWLAKEPEDCPDVGDTTCGTLTLAGPGGTTEPGLWVATCEGAADESGDPVWHVFTATNGIGGSIYIGPQLENVANMVLTPGHWVVTCTVDDDYLCLDSSESQSCSAEVDVVALPRILAHLSLDGDLLDGTGNGNDGSIVGGAPAFVRGYDCERGAALGLDGAADLVRIVQNDGLPVFNNFQYSVALWVKGMPQVDRRVYSEGNSLGNNNPLFNIGTDNTGATGTVDIFIRSDTGGALVNHAHSTGIAFDGTWHHIAFLDDNGACKLYIDGVLDPVVINYAKTALTVDTSTLGGILRATAGSWFAGQIDDVLLTNYLLSEAEIQGLLADEAEPCTDPQVAGDCNQDGLQNIADVMCYVKGLFPGFVLVPSTPSSPPCDGDWTTAGNLSVLDVNGDTLLNIADPIHLLNYVYSGGLPPAQGEGCVGVLDTGGCGINPGCEES